MKHVTLIALCFTVVGLASSSSADENANITYVSGTCKKATPEFNMSSFYNQESMLVSTFGGKDITGSDYDLGKDGAFVGYSVLYCATNSPGDDLLVLIRQKGFSVTSSCSVGSLLSYPRYHVFMLFDYIDSLLFDANDITAIKEFYIRGGGIYALTDNCPWFRNANPMYRGLPYPLNLFQMRYNNGIPYFPLANGNPVADNQFGHHPAFTGIPAMSSGTTLSIPYYDDKFGIGVFAPMCTTVIDRMPSACSGEPAASYVYAHASVMYVDPPVQLVNFSEACNWGRIVHDSAFTRYYVEPKRTGCHRLAANVVVWLTNIERIMERQSSGTPLNSTDVSNCLATVNSTTQDTDVNKTQVLGCSNGDAVTLKSPTLMCRVGFAGANAPACLALVVTESQGTTCVVDIQNAKIGTYWIMVDGKNSSLQFSVTAASLTPRGTITAVTGSCVKLSDTSASGCSDGASITIDWTLPYPRDLTLGLGSTASVCATFSVSGTFVYCRFKGLNNLAKGRYQTYINGVATGIPLTILTDKASLNKVLCSGSHSLSPQASNEVTETLTILNTFTPTSSSTHSVTRSPSLTSTLKETETSSMKISASVTVLVSATTTTTETLGWTLTRNASRTVTELASRSVELRRTWSVSGTRTVSRTTVLTTTHTAKGATISSAVTQSIRQPTSTRTLRITESASWGCVDSVLLSSVLSAMRPLSTSPRVSIKSSAVENGTTVALKLPPLMNRQVINASAVLHVPWFQRWEARGYIRVEDCPNQAGFEDESHRSVPVIVVFPHGIITSASDGFVDAALVLPPIPGYTIYARELVAVDMHLADMTLGHLCADGTTKLLRLPLLELLITVDVDQLLASAQETVTPVVAVMTAAVPFAAPDLQVMVALAMMPCSTSYQKRTFAMFRALSVFTLDDSYEGVLWGNLVANVAGLGLHVAVVGCLSAIKKVSLADAMTMAHFPSVYLQLLWQLTYASNAFAAVQLLADSSTTTSIRAFASGVLAVFVIGMPAALYGYVAWRVEAAYYVYQYHRWRRTETKLRVRLLSRFLMPVGRWDPVEVRRRLGPFVTLQSRPEHCWMLLPFISPIIVAVFSLVRYQSNTTCLYVYVVMALLHVCLVMVMVMFRPLRSMIEDWFGAFGYGLTMIYLCCAAITLAYPRAHAVDTVISVVVILQMILLFVRMVYHVCHIFISRGLWDDVPHILLFEWYCGRTRVEDDIDVDECRNIAGGGEKRPNSELYAELSELMAAGDDDVELQFRNDGGKDNDGEAIPFFNPFLQQPSSSTATEGDEEGASDIQRFGSGSGGGRKKGTELSNDELANLLGTMGLGTQ